MPIHTEGLSPLVNEGPKSALRDDAAGLSRAMLMAIRRAFNGKTGPAKAVGTEAGSSSFAVRLRFLDRLQVGDDRADVGVLENELRRVVAGDEALAQSLLERLDGIAPA